MPLYPTGANGVARPRICTMELCQSAVQKGRAAVDSKVVRGIVAPKGYFIRFSLCWLSRICGLMPCGVGPSAVSSTF